MSTETGETLKIKVFNVSKKDLQKDFGAAAEFTESALWKKIYEFEFGTYGGDPFGALMGDYEFDKGPMDVALLTSITEVAAASHAPFISGVSPRMFGMDSFTQMPDPRDLAKIFDKSNPENTKWISFRDSEDSRFCSLVLPHVLRRLPYSADANPVEDFRLRGGRLERARGVSLGQRRVRLRGAAHRGVRQAPLVRGDPRPRGRRSRRGSADPRVQVARGRGGLEDARRRS